MIAMKAIACLIAISLVSLIAFCVASEISQRAMSARRLESVEPVLDFSILISVAGTLISVVALFVGTVVLFMAS